MKTLLMMLLAAGAAGIDYPSVDAARKALEARDGKDAVVTHPEGWMVVNEFGFPSAQWSFTPEGHPAHPAVVKRVIERDAAGNVSVQTGLLCEAKASAACDQLRADFEALNDRIVQAVKSRGRLPPPPPAR